MRHQPDRGGVVHEAGRARRRTLPPRVRYGLISALSGHDGWRGLHLIEREQIQHLRAEIHASPAPAEDLVALLVAAPPMRLRVEGQAALDAVESDSRLILSGVSDPRAALTLPSRMIEGHLSILDADEFIAAHRLAPATERRENVRLHVDQVRPATPPPLAVILADLAQHDTTPPLVAFRKLLSTTE